MVRNPARIFTLAALFTAALWVGWWRHSSAMADAPEAGGFAALEAGLDFGEFVSPKKSPVGDSRVRVLRIDPRHFKFHLLNASRAGQGKRLSARDWAGRNRLVAAINASMYQRDFMTSVSLMKTGEHVNNSWFSKDRTILAFDPVSGTLPAVRIIDRDCENFADLRPKYRTLIQSIRMVSCRGKNVWAQSDKVWSAAAIGMDGGGRFLVIHSRSPYSMHDLIDILLGLPLDLKRAMYVEGGPDAQMYVKSGAVELEFIGSYSSGSHESDGNRFAWPVPNVLGISRAGPGVREDAGGG